MYKWEKIEPEELKQGNVVRINDDPTEFEIVDSYPGDDAVIRANCGKPYPRYFTTYNNDFYRGIKLPECETCEKWKASVSAITDLLHEKEEALKQTRARLCELKEKWEAKRVKEQKETCRPAEMWVDIPFEDIRAGYVVRGRDGCGVWMDSIYVKHVMKREHAVKGSFTDLTPVTCISTQWQRFIVTTGCKCQSNANAD
jgi:hypothetical protein